ncbi:hypothetical protein [Desulfogranum mediterraneum]|uniref:hypothetical protein n=1 Tax=Desulfogranum mediterraneum TaxID=160661 RepID=UPI000423DD8E|nr:hypothetical protein [Desulfogranum mediterraneum]
MQAWKQEVESFLQGWEESVEGNKKTFEQLLKLLEEQGKGHLEFHPRPGVTYSLRGVCDEQGRKPLYVMVDVIEDAPRWLSVCFYGELISDPQARGDAVPGGLLGEDAVCFDLDRFDAEALAYVEARIVEAYSQA